MGSVPRVPYAVEVEGIPEPISSSSGDANAAASVSPPVHEPHQHAAVARLFGDEAKIRHRLDQLRGIARRVTGQTVASLFVSNISGYAYLLRKSL